MQEVLSEQVALAETELVEPLAAVAVAVAVVGSVAVAVVQLALLRVVAEVVVVPIS